MIVISKFLTLGNWYRCKNAIGEPVMQWQRQDIRIPELDAISYLRKHDLTDVHIFPNIIDTLGVSFIGSLAPLNPIFRSIYNTYDKGFMSWDCVEEAKKEIDNFLIKYSKLKAFV